ncbi:hypothetical protein [Ruminococcus sp. NK3A76]|uniref:TRAFAC clade GTPase domain-containing protein n=1 Tax=Ruminococcus sp. NK3A76 TaxID=877411 RepID=UPI00048ED0F6|nr:hypothetical protein [Ruminococcus sp. NK3A76]
MRSVLSGADVLAERYASTASEHAQTSFGILGWVLVCIAALIISAGVFHAIRCFLFAFILTNNDMKIREHKPQFSKDALPRGDDGSLKSYEQIAAPGYFNKRVIQDMVCAVKNAWKNIGSAVQDFLSNINYAEGIKKAGAFLLYTIMIASTVVFGGIASAAVTLIIAFGYMLLFLGYHLFFAVCVSAERIFFRVRKISYRCDFCKESYRLPVYLCPECGIPHRSLRPSKFGVFHRVCTCGTLLPSTAVSKTNDGKKREELSAVCPQCARSDKSRLSRPLGIALIGGVAVGKTTFKTAFLYKFINEDAVRFNIETEFPDEATEFNFGEIEKSFKGMRPITATKPGQEYDVVSFNFFIDHKRLDIKRYLHLYDMPGEVFETNNSKERLRHFAFSEGVVFVVDPYSMQSVIDNSDGLGSMDIGHMDFDVLIQVFLETLSGLQNIKKEGGKYILPIAVAINKVDTPQLKSLIGSIAIAKLQKADPETYKEKFDTMDYLCRSFLVSNDKSNAVMLLDQNFKHVHFFSCSSMGYVPKDAVARFVPENVTNIVHWLLTRSDKALGTVWRDEPVNDMTEKHKQVWAEHRGDYAKYIESDI